MRLWPSNSLAAKKKHKKLGVALFPGGRLEIAGHFWSSQGQHNCQEVTVAFDGQGPKIINNAMGGTESFYLKCQQCPPEKGLKVFF